MISQSIQKYRDIPISWQIEIYLNSVFRLGMSVFLIELDISILADITLFKYEYVKTAAHTCHAEPPKDI